MRERDDSGEIRHGCKLSGFLGFWKEHAKGELRTRRSHEILRFLSPCWEKEYLDKVFYAAFFVAFVQELLSMPINLRLALYWYTPELMDT